MMNIGKILPGYRIIEKDEKFCFKCDMCGNCCRNRDDILLNGYDVFRISDYLKLTAGELVLSYCKVYIGPNSNIPCVTLLLLGPYKISPFLIQRKCAINEVKPVNCAMYPLGRIQNGTTGEEHYIINEIDCGTKDKEQTIDKWIRNANLTDEYRQCRDKWRELMDIAVQAREHLPLLSEQDMNQAYNLMFELLYLNYESTKPYVPQVAHNAERMTQLVDCIKNTKKN